MDIPTVTAIQDAEADITEDTTDTLTATEDTADGVEAEDTVIVAEDMQEDAVALEEAVAEEEGGNYKLIKENRNEYKKYKIINNFHTFERIFIYNQL